GDPRGELALLWRAAERAGDGDERLSLRRRADAHARRFRARLYGPLHWEGLLERVSFGLRDGFIERAHLSAEIAPRALWRLCAVLFELPLACALRALSIEPGAQQKLVDALLELAVPPTLERLVLGRDEEAGAEAPASSYGMGNVERLEPLLARLPSLRSLQLRGETTDRVELELPELEQLRVDARYVGRFVDSLPQARCPRLRELDLRVRFFTKSAAARVLRLVEAPPPALDSLSLRGIEAVEPVVRALTASTLAARLRQLTLVSTQPAHEAMTHLGRHADALAALESLHIAPLDDEIRGALGPLAARLAEAPP
ncbi:MAG: hypothetical protein KC503_31800, partial [Myxococcales bacterium]|nr:hypothetical protein [Myxococcales bacterium]